MTEHDLMSPRTPDMRLQSIIKLAILAVGGQGGGVLTGWIEAMARANGYVVQATSVAGVAQRTGATVYYVEMAPCADRQPIFSLMPATGDVDILIAAELMEAGRAIMRGFVTPNRTVLIASSHRALAIAEKTVPGNGLASGEEVKMAADIASQRLICADFDILATKHGSVISATLFGALAASETLPFAREAFEDTIRAGRKGVDASLQAFAAGFDTVGRSEDPAAPVQQPDGASDVTGPRRQMRLWQDLIARVAGLPAAAQEMAEAGLRRVVQFQDVDYGKTYLQRLDRVAARDRSDGQLTREAAKYLANAMAYDDIISVADAKTRCGRRDRIAKEMGAGEADTLQVTEFLRPRAKELVSMLPAKMGARWAANPRHMARIDRAFGRGRRIRTDRLLPFLSLYILGGLRGWRRRTLRHAEETERIEAWLDQAIEYAKHDNGLATEILRCQRLIKGYSDTHARGTSKFARVMEGIPLVAGRDDAAEWVARMRDMALADEDGEALNGALKTIRSFA